MKLLRLFPLLFLLGSCTQLPGSKTPSSEVDAVAPDIPTPNDSAPAQLSPDPDDSLMEAEFYLPVGDWLVQRQNACGQEDEAIDAQLSRYRESFAEAPSDGEDARIVLAYSQLKALMLATCNPARTPGLLKNFLDTITEYEQWPPEYSALFDLLQSEYQAYALLEQKYQALEARHQKTIDGIGNIEQSLESQPTP